MQPVLFDSSIYITALRTGDGAAVAKAVGSRLADLAECGRIEELYAGIAARGRHVLERFERDFEKARRILVPNLNDWTQTGKSTRPFGSQVRLREIGQGRLTNDALIAMTLPGYYCDHRERGTSCDFEFRPFNGKSIFAAANIIFSSGAVVTKVLHLPHGALLKQVSSATISAYSVISQI
jgi:hypothetical protein